MNLPFPQDTETRSEFALRWKTHKAVLATYPTPGARIAGLEKVWKRAREQSLVYIKGAMDEMVLFGAL